VKPAQLAARLRAFARARGVAGLERFGPAVPTTLRPTELVALFVDFFEAHDVEGRRKGPDADGVHQDDLLYQHGPSGVNVTRQLYRAGRGLQVGVTLAFDPTPKGKVTLWRGNCGSSSAWRAQVEQALRAAGLLDRAPTTLTAATDRF
jgi:hypothetical protein